MRRLFQGRPKSSKTDVADTVVDRSLRRLAEAQNSAHDVGCYVVVCLLVAAVVLPEGMRWLLVPALLAGIILSCAIQRTLRDYERTAWNEFSAGGNIAHLPAVLHFLEKTRYRSLDKIAPGLTRRLLALRADDNPIGDVAYSNCLFNLICYDECVTSYEARCELRVAVYYALALIGDASMLAYVSEMVKIEEVPDVVTAVQHCHSVLLECARQQAQATLLRAVQDKDASEILLLPAGSQADTDSHTLLRPQNAPALDGETQGLAQP